MAAISALTDQELDELLAGRTPDGRGELAPLADVAMAVRERTAVEPAPVMAYSLRQAVARGSVPVAPRPRRLMPVAVGAFALTGISLAGAANALPAPVQDMVADAGDLVGVDIPHSTDDDVIETDDLSTTTDRPLADGVGSDAEPKNQPGPTPGGATPADPGTPADQTPATPAIPPDHSGGGSDNGTGQGTGNAPTGTVADENADENADGNADERVDENADGSTDDGTGQGNADAGNGQGTVSSNGKANGGPNSDGTGNAGG